MDVIGAEVLVSRNEKVMVEARRNYYENVHEESKHEKLLKIGEFTGKVYYIIFVLYCKMLVLEFIFTFRPNLLVRVKLGYVPNFAALGHVEVP